MISTVHKEVVHRTLGCLKLKVSLSTINLNGVNFIVWIQTKQTHVPSK